jgi:drug/metabolite transporter (DMT)-like permease
MSRRHLIMLLVLSAVWGASFMLIKVAVRTLDPSVVAFGRFFCATLVLLALLPLRMSFSEAWAGLRSYLLPLALFSIPNAALPFWLIPWSETRIDSGLAATLQAAAPLFTALVAVRWMRDERVTGWRLVGVAGGFVGVALLVGASPHGSVLAALAVVLAAFCYAIAVLYMQARLGMISTFLVTLASMAFGALFLLPGALLRLPSHVPGWKALTAVIALGAVGTALTFLVYFELVAGAGASRAILVTYITPAMALFYGVTFLGEKLTWAEVGGLALILGGVSFATGAVRARRRTPIAVEP